MAHKRQFINSPEDFVQEAIEGLGIAHSYLVTVNSSRGLISRLTPKETGKVGLVSGGGSGHEPLHGGFVGKGMLDVAVSGAVFASPTSIQIHEGTLLANRGAGVLHIVKNYTGDVINFDMAADLASDDNIEVATVLVNDDVATAQSEGPGRRGTAAVIAVEKMCGAAAEQGQSLPELKKLGDRIVANSATMGLAIEAGTLPGKSAPGFDLEQTEVEYGVGIHGERGRRRIEFESLDPLVYQLVDEVVADLAMKKGSQVLAIVNGLGSTHPLELSIAARAAEQRLVEHGVKAVRWLVGNYVTSLDMRGISISCIRLDKEMLELWDEPVNTPALSWEKR